MTSRRVIALVSMTAFVGVSLATGCSFSKSSGASSKSSSSPSRWISQSSKSSSGGGAEVDDKAYEEDVAQTTAAFVASGGDFTAYRRVMGQLADQHGISNWENDRPTLRAVGVGIARATDDPARQAKAIDLIAAGDEKRKQWLQEGAGRNF
ncbi:MAG: hypothetical protein ACQGVK_08020 [Myxococcota bacterium]